MSTGNRFLTFGLVVALLLVVNRPLIGRADVVNLNGLSSLAETIDETQNLILPTVEQRLWREKTTTNNFDELDRRLITETLPYLASQFGPLQAELLKDYAADEQKTSRELDGASNVSQRHLAKAAAITALGNTSCANDVLFGRELDPVKPLWLHYQTEESNSPAVTPFFGRSFDMVARQAFYLPARAFTNRPITSQSWSNFLQQLAKGEIEERFGLPPGALANVAVSDLPERLAEARLARQLGLPNLPDGKSEPRFYQSIGQRQWEIALNLPTHSLTGKSWYELYQNIGFRVLEQQLALPETGTESSVFADSDLTTNARFIQLAKRLANRGSLYQNPVLAFNLPTDQYLPANTATGQSDIFNRLKNGDPAAFATAGAYFLADSLNLPASDTAILVQALDRDEDRVPAIASARPLPASLQATKLFAAETSENERLSLFESLGRSQIASRQNQLATVNGNVLLALTGGSRAPALNDIIAILTSLSRRQGVLADLAKTSLSDADYPDGLTVEALRRRGQELLAEATELTVSSLAKLDQPNLNRTDPAVQATAQTVEAAMGWPAGAALDLAQRENQTTSESSGQLQDKQLVEIGATILWRRLGLSPTLQQALNDYYFSGLIDTLPPSLPTETVSTDETAPTETPSPGGETSDTSGDTTGEVITFALPSAQTPLADAIGQELKIPASQTTNLLTGRLYPATKQLTLAALGRELGDASTLTPAKLLTAYQQPTAERWQAIADQQSALRRSSVVDPAAAQQLTNPTADPTTLWQTLDATINRQWNMTCPDKRAEVATAIDKLVAALVNLPDADHRDPTTDQAERPVQILTYKKDDFSAATAEAITEAYPGLGDPDVRWGVYAAPRAWDHLYIGY